MLSAWVRGWQSLSTITSFHIELGDVLTLSWVMFSAWVRGWQSLSTNTTSYLELGDVVSMGEGLAELEHHHIVSH